MTKKIYKIKGMHCTSCAMNIEGELEDLGINAKVNFAKSILEVEIDENKVSEKEMVKAVNNLGYQLI